MTSSDNNNDDVICNNAKILIHTSTDMIRARSEFNEICFTLNRIDRLLLAWPQYYPRYREDLKQLVSAAKRRYEVLEYIVERINIASLAGRKYESFRNKDWIRQIQDYEREMINLPTNHSNYAMELRRMKDALLVRKEQYAWPWYADEMDSFPPFWIKLT